MPGDYNTEDNYNSEVVASRLVQQIVNSDVQSFGNHAAREGGLATNDVEAEINREMAELGPEEDNYNSDATDSVVRRLESQPFNQRQFAKEGRARSRAAQAPPPPASTPQSPPASDPPFSQRAFVKDARKAATYQAHDKNIKDVESKMKPSTPAPPGLHGVGDMYRLEKADPKHRMGGVLYEFLTIYKQTAMRTPFFEWIDRLSYFEVCQILKQHKYPFYLSHAQGMHPDKSDLEHKAIADQKTNEYVRTNAPAFMRGVKYLDAATRTQYAVTVQGGLLYWQGEPLDTEKKKLETVFSGVGWAMWVLSPNDVLYANSHLKGLSHHSSFLAGGKIKGAGEFVVKAGRLDLITGKSGHYKCDVRSIQESLKIMQNTLGISMTQTRVVVWRLSDQEAEAISAADFINDATIEQRYRVIGQAAYRPAANRKPASERIGAIGGHRAKATAQ